MKTKDMLKEWKSFLTETTVIPLSQIKLSMIKKRYSREDIEDLTSFWTSNNYLSKYSHVILNDIEKGEPIDHILSTIKQHYFKIYQGGGPKLKDEISSGNISCDDLRKHLDAKSTFNKREIRKQCSYENGRPVVGSYQDFDVVYSESDWIVIEPKTIQGSIAWTHGKPDGSEETDQARRSGWCTGVTTGNNMFPNYAGNLHMFYFISADYESNRTPNRRLCISFEVKDGEVYITNKSDAVVDANNDPLESSLKEKIKKSSPYKEIVERIKDRKDTSFSEIYSKATLSQIIRTIQQLKQNSSKEEVERELKAYILNTTKLEVLEYFYKSSYLEKKGLVISRSLESNIDPNYVIANRVLDNNKESEIDHLARNFNDNRAFDILSRIVKSNFKWPKVTLSKNRNIVNDKVLNILLKENDDDINEGVLRRIDINSKFCQDIAFNTDNINIMSSLVERDDCTEKILLHFIDKCKNDSSGFYKRIIYNVIKNKNCTSSMVEDIYDFYSDSNDYFLIKNIVKSHLCPKEVLNDIALNNNQVVIDRLIALNPTCDSRILRNFYYNTNDSTLRKNVLQNENIEKEILVNEINKPFTSFDKIITILSNPNTPPEIVESFILQKSYIAKLEKYVNKDEDLDDYEDDYEDEFNDEFFKSFIMLMFNKNFESFSSKVKSILNKKIDDFAKDLNTYDFSMETFIDTFVNISLYQNKTTAQNASKRIFFSPGVQNLKVEWEYASRVFNKDSFHEDVVNYIYNSALDSGEFAYTCHVVEDERFPDNLIPKVVQDLRNNRDNYEAYNYNIVTKFLAKKGIQIEDNIVNENKKLKKYSLKIIYSNLI